MKSGATEESNSSNKLFTMDSARDLAVNVDHNAENSDAYINYSHVGTKVETQTSRKRNIFNDLILQNS